MRRAIRATLLLGSVGIIGAALFGGIAAARGPSWGEPDGDPRSGALRLFDEVDKDKDGRVTDAEVQAARQERFQRFDANSDGVLSLDEYRAFWADFTERMMVRSFQRQDEDGDARVTGDEFGAILVIMTDRLDRNDDGAVSRDELMHTGRHGRGPHRN